MNEMSMIKYKLYKEGRLKAVSYSQITNFFQEHEITNGVLAKEKILAKIDRDIRFYKNFNKKCDTIKVFVDNDLFTVVDLTKSKMTIKKGIKAS